MKDEKTEAQEPKETAQGYSITKRQSPNPRWLALESTTLTTYSGDIAMSLWDSTVGFPSSTQTFSLFLSLSFKKISYYDYFIEMKSI